MIKNNLLKFILIILLAGLFSGTASAQDFPEKPSPPKLVNDFTGLLGNGEVNALERKLVIY